MRTFALTPEAIDQINSLGGPPLPADACPETLRVILENQAAANPSKRFAQTLQTLLNR